ncbi:2-C-methyl-D-erythritol 4-phosphate cytidylyltransferase [soil metagenome]
MTVAAVLVAAGSGERFAAAAPKAFVELAGEPLLVHALRALLGAASIDEVVVVVGEQRRAQAAAALEAAGLPPAALVAGGATRAESVRSGVAATAADVVAVHDAARPLVSPGLVNRVVAALYDHTDTSHPLSAVAPALAVVDTLKLVEPTRMQVLHTIDRRALWAVQTPQVFARRTLQRVHRRLKVTTATDDLVLVEEAGGRVHLIEGERRNFKITYPEDLAMAEALLRTSC